MRDEGNVRKSHVLGRRWCRPQVLLIKDQDLTTLWFERRHFYLVLSVNAIGQLKMTRDNSRNGDVFVKGFPPQCVAIESQSHFL